MMLRTSPGTTTSLALVGGTSVPEKQRAIAPAPGKEDTLYAMELALSVEKLTNEKLLNLAGKNAARPCLEARYGGDLSYEKLSRFCEEGELKEAIETLHRLVKEGYQINDSLLYFVLKRCIAKKDLVLGKCVHGLAIRTGYESDAFLGNHIIRMYISHGKLEEAMQVFAKVKEPNAHNWAAIILAHALHGQPKDAINLYQQVRQSTIKPDNHIFVAVLKACANAGDLAFGKEVHGDIMGNAGEPNIFVSNCLVDMYSKCGSLEQARSVFDGLRFKDVVTWTAMISGYTQHGLGQEALSLYASMQQEAVTPANHVTFMSLLQACGSIGALYQGKHLHAQIQERGLEADVLVGNCLVDMYAKCGRLEDARKVFNRLPRRTVVSWTAMLNGYAQQGNGQMAIRCFEEMRQQGCEPDETTYSCLLVACSQSGLVHEGQKYFELMQGHGIAPNAYHYNCLVDLLARSGRLDEAECVLESMPFKEGQIVGWRSLLSACKSQGDLERGRRCFDHLTALEPESAAAYALLGNLYANTGRWRDVDRIETLRRSAGAKKKPAKACIEVKSKVHEFAVGENGSDTSSKLRSVNLRLKDEGSHVPQTELVLKVVSERDKEDALCGHAEKLALAYGLLNTSDGETLLVTKNLRMCSDCHSSTKVMSRLEKREVIVRDAHRIHRFLDGFCSCGDRQ